MIYFAVMTVSGVGKARLHSYPGVIVLPICAATPVALVGELTVVVVYPIAVVDIDILAGEVGCRRDTVRAFRVIFDI